MNRISFLPVRQSMPYTVQSVEALLQQTLSAYLKTDPAPSPLAQAPDVRRATKALNVTPKDRVGARWHAFNIDGMFYARVSQMSLPPAVKWYKVGAWPQS